MVYVDECAGGYKYFTKGGYGNIYINESKTEILKEEPLYYVDADADAERESLPRINISAFRDVIFLNAVRRIDGCSKITSVSVSAAPAETGAAVGGAEIDRKINIKMPYYGKTLHEWVREMPYAVIKQHANNIILAITKTCIEMKKIGIQHTDLKPTNIIITPDNKPVIIDFNLCSVKTTQQTKYGWSYSVGTWCYSPPEIPLFELPHSTSSCWCIGILYIYILLQGAHPLEFIQANAGRINSQREWLVFIESIRKRNTTHLLAPPNILHTAAYAVYSRCCIWNPRHRIRLEEIYSIFNRACSSNGDTSTGAGAYNFAIAEEREFCPTSKCRNTDIAIIWNILKTSYIYLLCRAISLYDLTGNIAASICIAFMIDNDVFEYSPLLIEAIRVRFDLNMSKIDKLIIDTCEALGWDCYYKCADIIILESSSAPTHPQLYSILCDVMRNTREKYTMTLIAQKYAAAAAASVPALLSTPAPAPTPPPPPVLKETALEKSNNADSTSTAQ